MTDDEAHTRFWSLWVRLGYDHVPIANFYKTLAEAEKWAKNGRWVHSGPKGTDKYI